MNDELRRTHAALCSPFIDTGMFRAALGGSQADIGTIFRYLGMPLHLRPALSPYFDRTWYTACNPDVRDSGADALLHFITTGFAELRAPHPLVDLAHIVAQDEHVLGTPRAISALCELLEFDLIAPSPYFDPAHYARALGEKAPAQGLLRHFLTSGLAQGHRPNRFLDPLWYAASRADVPRDGYGALRHFVVLGDLAGHRASPEFDGAMYRARYPDVAGSAVAPLLHYLLHGRHEGRQAVAERFVPQSERKPRATPPLGAALEVDADEVRDTWRDTRARLDAMWQARKDAVVAARPNLFAVGDPRRGIETLAFAPAPAPRLSILIPVFNELDYTIACLVTLVEATLPFAFEVIVADDCSTDPDVALLGAVENLVYLRQPANLGFLRNCNAAYARCRAPIVLLLNNDTQVLWGAIERMLAVLDENPDVAAVGPKLIYGDGRLQEAGCYIRANGESGMVGLFADPNEPAYCYDRDVAYCSGAALMFRRACAGDTLFDEAYLPAYCEDADLCLRFIAAGHRVRFVHDAVVVHHLSVSTNRHSQSRKHRRIVRNQQTLCERWSDLLRDLDRIRPLAFYLPQFHPTAENDFWWGAGFTEWTNVVKAQPSYTGHYQPHVPADLGFYDLRARDTLMRQAALALRYGIEGFCVYHYNFGSRRVLHQPMDLVRADPSIPFHWCLCWANENWTRNWDGGEREILLEQRYDDATIASVLADAVAHAADPRYIRVHGRPLFLVYRPLMLPDAAAFARACRAAFARAGLPGVHLVYVESMEAVKSSLRPDDIGFDAAVEFPPQGRAVPTTRMADIVKEGWSGYRYDYTDTVSAFLKRPGSAYKRYPAVFPSWDNTARQPLRGTSFEDCSPEAFRLYTEAKIDEAREFFLGEERLLFVNAWNEWAEGAHLEPDALYGHRWLEALRDALAAKAIR